MHNQSIVGVRVRTFFEREHVVYRHLALGQHEDIA
jgi:hypothetical protein